MQISDSLNLVLDVGDGLKAYHTPISRAVYEVNYDLLNSVKATISGKGDQYLRMSGPFVANLTLKDEGIRDAESRNRFDANGKPVDERTPALLAEIKRLTMIMAPSASGYEIIPVDTAMSSGKMDSEDWAELESAIIFFTSYVLTAKKAIRTGLSLAVASILQGEITSSLPTEYIASLPTSTKAEATPKAASSVPV